MPTPQFKPGWQINCIEASTHISADLTPPQTIDDLLEPPSQTMSTNCPIGYPTKEDAIEALKARIAFLQKDSAFIRSVFARHNQLDAEILSFLNRKDAYLQAACKITAEL
jgi:uncharacterized protein YdcH (DUF465 family)